MWAMEHWVQRPHTRTLQGQHFVYMASYEVTHAVANNTQNTGQALINNSLTAQHVGLLMVAVLGALILVLVNTLGICVCKQYFSKHAPGHLPTRIPSGFLQLPVGSRNSERESGSTFAPSVDHSTAKLPKQSPNMLVWEARDYVMSRRSYWHRGMSKYHDRYSGATNLHHNDCRENKVSLWQKPKHFSSRSEALPSRCTHTLHPDSANKSKSEMYPSKPRDESSRVMVGGGISEHEHSSTDSNSSNAAFLHRSTCTATVDTNRVHQVAADVHCVPQDSAGETAACAHLTPQPSSVAEGNTTDEHCADMTVH